MQSIHLPLPPPLLRETPTCCNCKAFNGSDRSLKREGMSGEGEPPWKKRKADTPTEVCTSTGASRRGPFYAVREGRSGQPRVFSSWAECEQEVRGVSGAAFKKFRTLSEAVSFAAGEGLQGAAADPVHQEQPSPPPVSPPLLRGAPRVGGHRSPVVVYTDGACPGQHTGDKEARLAGCGVWFGHGDERNIGTANPFPPHTSNRAEMVAVLLAMQAFRRSGESAARDLHVMSDSEYVVRGMREWLPAWEKRQFRRAGGAPVKNADLWKKLSAERRALGGWVTFEHVRGHAGDEGNEEADRLAREGALLGEKTELEGGGACASSLASSTVDVSQERGNHSRSPLLDPFDESLLEDVPEDWILRTIQEHENEK